MSPVYRVPDPWALRHRRAIKWTAGLVGLAGFIGLAMLPDAWNIPILMLWAGDFLLFSWLSHRYSPGGFDYYDYLVAQAKDTDMMDWLDAVDRDFIELWALDNSKPGDFSNPGALIREVFME